MSSDTSVIANIVGSIVIAVIASGGTYMAMRRKNSGKVDTTEAATLWAESQAMRQELREEVERLRNQLEDAQDTINTLRGKLDTLDKKI